LYLYFTFANFQNISKTILPIYNNPLNNEKDWVKFLINLNSKLCLINDISDSIILVKNKNKKLYSNKIDFILNDYIEIENETNDKLENETNLELKEYDIGYEKISLTKKEKYFISYDSIDSSINFGPITNYELNLLTKRIKGIILKKINDIEVINIPIKINIANNIVNKLCEILKIKYSIIKNNTECEFLITLDNLI